MDAAALVQSVRGQLARAVRPLRLPAASLTALALDVCLVGTGVRTATLIDQFAPTLRACEAMADALANVPGIDPVLLVLFVPAKQVFVVHQSCMQMQYKQHELHTYVNVAPNHTPTVREPPHTAHSYAARRFRPTRAHQRRLPNLAQARLSHLRCAS